MKKNRQRLAPRTVGQRMVMSRVQKPRVAQVSGRPMRQLPLFEASGPLSKTRPTRALKPLLKWVGNKQRFAEEIISYFPVRIGTYFEPFLGSGAILGTLAPARAVGSDLFEPLVAIWRKLSASPETLKKWYAERWHATLTGDKVTVYERIKASYNSKPNAADLLFICRSCYGGVVRFRKEDGYISTPCGVHNPIRPNEFARRVDEWHRRTRGTTFYSIDFEETMKMAENGDMIYCDPPYTHSQSILYGAQAFELRRLFDVIAKCKSRGILVALSIDGTKKSGNMVCDVPIPQGLFKREVLVSVGRSMLKRFQMGGRSLESEVVADRLMLTY